MYKSFGHKDAWTLKHIGQLHADKMFAGGEIKGSGRSIGLVKQCLISSEMKGVSIEYITINPRQRFLAHIHHRTEAFLIIARGSGTIILNGKSIRLKKGDLVYIPPRTAHGFRTKSNFLEFISVQRPPVLTSRGKEDLEVVERP